MIANVTVCNLHQMLQTEFIESNNIDSVLSIIDPQRAGVIEAYHTHLKNKKIVTKSIYFYDVCDKDCRLSPSFECVVKCYNFLKDLHLDNKHHNLLIHCYAGRCRSTAIALIALYLKTGNELDSINELYKIRSKASPNALILEYIDQLLNTQFENYVYQFLFKNKKVDLSRNDFYTNLIKTKTLPF